MYGTGLIFLVIIFTLLALGIGRGVQAITKKKAHKYITLVVMWSIPLGWFGLNYIPGHLVLAELCEKTDRVFKEGPWTGQPHLSIDYTCGWCWEKIASGKYEYLEFDVRKSVDELYKLTPTPGLYRVSAIRKTPETLDQCWPLEETFSDSLRKKHQSFFSEQCIKVETIDKPNSQYSTESGTDSFRIADYRSHAIYQLNKKAYIKEIFHIVKETGSGNPFHERRYYTYFPYGGAGIGKDINTDCHD